MAHYLTRLYTLFGSLSNQIQAGRGTLCLIANFDVVTGKAVMPTFGPTLGVLACTASCGVAECWYWCMLFADYPGGDDG
jgi:hypothetical protein